MIFFNTGANLPSECCFNNYGRKIPIAKIDSYIETRVDCPKPGVMWVLICHHIHNNYNSKNLLYCVNKISVWSNCDLFLLPVLSQRRVIVCARILSWAGWRVPWKQSMIVIFSDAAVAMINMLKGTLLFVS